MPGLLFGTNAQKAYEAARQRATDTTDIFDSGTVDIHASFRIYPAAGQITGTYRYSQLSKNEVRVDVQSPDFNESLLERGGEQYTLRSRDLEPLAIWYLRQLVRTAHAVPHYLVSSTTQDSPNSTCFGQERTPGTRFEYYGARVCFDQDTGVLMSAEWSFNTDRDRLEFSDFQKVEGKLFPATMRRFRNGKLFVEVSVETVTHAGANEALFVPPTNAVRQQLCTKFQPAEQSEYSEDYFRIRSSYKSGSVVIGGLLDEQGKVQKTEIEESDGAKMDEAALNALKETHVHPAKCDGKAVQAFFRFQIWFSPAPHPDSFQSFR